MKRRLNIVHIENDFAVDARDNPMWKRANEVVVSDYWSGEAAPAGRHFAASLLWSDKALYVGFEANQTEPLIVSENPELSTKTVGLWDRDVCEIFIAPDQNNPDKYFEFEIAPTGEWIDLGVEVLPDRRETEWDYESGMNSAARIEENKVVMAIKIEWRAFGRIPKAGDIWLGNLFRCVGKDPTRGYLSWIATETSEPSFHVPSKFGEFAFVK